MTYAPNRQRGFYPADELSRSAQVPTPPTCLAGRTTAFFPFLASSHQSHGSTRSYSCCGTGSTTSKFSPLHPHPTSPTPAPPSLPPPPAWGYHGSGTIHDSSASGWTRAPWKCPFGWSSVRRRTGGVCDWMGGGGGLAKIKSCLGRRGVNCMHACRDKTWPTSKLFYLWLSQEMSQACEHPNGAIGQSGSRDDGAVESVRQREKTHLRAWKS